MTKESRKDRRVALPGTILFSWQDPAGELKVARGKCLDFSRTGMRVELPQPVPLRTYVTVRSESAGLTFNASVRNCSISRGKSLLGLEFTCRLKPTDSRFAKALDSILGEA